MSVASRYLTEFPVRCMWLVEEEAGIEFASFPELPLILPEPFPEGEGEMWLAWCQEMDLLWVLRVALVALDLETIARIRGWWEAQREAERAAEEAALEAKLNPEAELERELGLEAVSEIQ